MTSPLIALSLVWCVLFYPLASLSEIDVVTHPPLETLLQTDSSSERNYSILLNVTVGPPFALRRLFSVLFASLASTHFMATPPTALLSVFIAAVGEDTDRTITYVL